MPLYSEMAVLGVGVVILYDSIDFQVVFDNVPTPLMLMSFDFNIIDMNQAYLDVVQRSRETLLGAYVFDAFPAEGESRSILESSLLRARDHGTTDVIPAFAYDIPIGDHFEQRYWSCSHVPIRDRHGDIVGVLQNTQDVTQMVRQRGGQNETLAPMKSSLGTTVINRAQTLQALNRTLLAETSHLRNLFMQAPSFMSVLRGPTHIFELVNIAFLKLVGDRDLIGKTVREGVPEIADQEYLGLLDTVFRTGEAFVGRQMRLFLQRQPDGPRVECYLDFVYQPIFDEAGGVTGIFVEGSDVTDHVRSEQRQSFLIRELHHRVRNTLATVQGVMNSTARTSATIEEYQEAFTGRIASLARTHALLTEEIEQSVPLFNLLTQELGPYVDDDGQRIRLEGPPVDLPSQIAVPLGMTIHELTTNAVRFGALAHPAGRIGIRWQIVTHEGRRALDCEWEEQGGAPIVPPTRQGFGSMLLQRVLAQQIGAEVTTSYKPEGFRLKLIIPLQAESAVSRR